MINWWGVIAAVAYSMAVGAAWYAKPIFGSYWMRAAKVRPEDGNPAVALTMTALLAAVTAVGVSLFAHFVCLVGDARFFEAAFFTALAGWVVFTASRMTTQYLFENRPAGLMILNVGNELVTLAGMGAIIGLCGPVWLH